MFKSHREKTGAGAILGHLLAAGVVLPPLIWLLWAVIGAAASSEDRFLDPVARRLLGQSLLLAAVVTAAAVTGGAFYGWCVARYRFPGRGLFRALTLLPLLLPPYASAYAWSLLLTREGWLNTTLLNWGWIQQPLQPFRSFWLAALVLATAYWPVAAWLTQAAAGSIPRDLEDAARLNTGAGQAARWTAGPAVRPALGAAAILVFLLALADFGVPNSLGLPTYPVEIVNRFQYDRDSGRVARLALPLLFLVTPLVWVQIRALDRSFTAPAERGGPRPLKTGWARAAGMAFGCALLPTLSFIPAAALAAHSLPPENYRDVWAESQGHFLNTLISAGGGALVAVSVALAQGWASRGRVHRLLDLPLTLPYALPGSLFGVAMIQILNRPLLGDLYTSMGGLVWTYAAFLFPFAYKTLQPAWSRIDRELVEEGDVLGAGAWTQFRVAALPVVRPYAWIGGALVVLLAAREMDATALLRIPGGDTLAFRIHDYLHFAPTPKVAALCMLVVAVGLAAAVMSRLLWNRSRDEE